MQLHTQNNVNVYEQVYKKAPIFHQMKRFLYVHIQKRGCVISLWRTLFVFFLFPRYGIEKIVFIYNKAQTFTSSGFVFPQKMCIFAENLLKYGKGTNKI